MPRVDLDALAAELVVHGYVVGRTDTCISVSSSPSNCDIWSDGRVRMYGVWIVDWTIQEIIKRHISFVLVSSPVPDAVTIPRELAERAADAFESISEIGAVSFQHRDQCAADAKSIKGALQ